MKKVKPTKLQRTTVEILKDNPKMSLAKAMVEAGYSPSTARHPGYNFVASKGTTTALDQWREALRGSGLNENKIIEKYKEWLDANRVTTSLTDPDRVVPDYQTQLKAGEMLREDLGIKVKDAAILQQFNIDKMGVEFIEGNVESQT
jgi:hypothetical protein